MIELKRIARDWACPVVVAATGPSLTPAVAERVRRARWPEERCRVVAVNDAYRLLPYADVLYACDQKWWQIHGADVAERFHGERWTTYEKGCNEKDGLPCDVNLVAGTSGDEFSSDPGLIRYGSNSGFQGINFALLKGATRVILVGFDMRIVGAARHFFGDHPEGLSNATDYESFATHFARAARTCKVPIVNATPGSALTCWPRVDLDEALAGAAAGPHDLLHCDRAEPVARTG